MIRSFAISLALLLMMPVSGLAASREELDARVQEALQELYAQSSAARELGENAQGILVFPRVYRAGVGIGGRYGEGALLVDGQPVAYYNTAGASIGFQLGMQRLSQVIMFRTDEALAGFRASEGWEVGVDGSVALATLGAGGNISSETLREPIIGFVYSNEGLMYNLTLEGTKITEIEK